MNKSVSIPDEVVVSKIHLIRNQKVMLDDDLAELNHVETRRLNEQVKRNMDRFPGDFMFQLTEVEWQNLKSQNATSSWGGRRKTPYAFTEHGVLMLSSVLNSKSSDPSEYSDYADIRQAERNADDKQRHSTEARKDGKKNNEPRSGY